MMRRTQISLDDQLLRRARKRSAELGVSLAEYIRRLLTRDLVRTAPRADVSAVFDLGSGSGSDIARQKDEMIGRAIAAERSPGYGEK